MVVVLASTTFARLAALFRLSFPLLLILLVVILLLMLNLMMLGVLLLRDFPNHLRTQAVDCGLVLLQDHDDFLPHDVKVFDHISVPDS